MERHVSVSSDTVQAHVVVLEDHDETANCIDKELKKDGKIVEVADTYEKFESLVRKENKFDVCSVDWKIGKRNVGSSALDLIRTYEQDAGKVVYSVYVNQPHIRREAKEGGADFILGKVGENYDAYRSEVERAARLGLSRQIRRRLAELEDPVEIGFTPNTEEENILFSHARRIGLELALAGQEDELISLLKRRGWFLSFDNSFYSDLSFEQKFALLFDYVKATEADLAQILQFDEAETRKLLEGNQVEEKNELIVDELLSILAYVLRLSRYEPELMPHYWRITRLFDGSLSSPPWDMSGLHEYLKSSGVTGIGEALHWIRSH